MGTVIDELVTILGLDIAPGVLPKVQKFNTLIESVTRYVGWASAGLVAAATSVGYFAERMNKASLDIAKMSKVTGLNAQEMQAWGFAAEQAGGSFDGMMQDMTHLAKSMSSPIPGEFNHGLFMLGVSAYDAAGKLKSADQVMLEIAQKFQGMSKIEQAQWGDKIGLSQDTVLTLGLGVTKLKQLQQEAKSFPLVLSDKQLENVMEFNRQMGFVRRILVYIGEAASSAAGPALRKIYDIFKKWVGANREFIQLGLENIIRGIIAGFERFGNLIQQVMTWFAQAFPWIEKFVGGLTDVNVISAIVFSALAALLGVLIIMAAQWVLVGAAIVAAGLIIEDLVTYLQGGNSAIGEMVKWVEKLWESFSQKFPGISKLVESLGRIFKALGKIILDDLVQGFKLAWEGLKSLGDKVEWVLGLIGKIWDKFADKSGLNKVVAAGADKLEAFADTNEDTLKGFVKNARDYNKAQDYNKTQGAPASSGQPQVVNNKVEVTQNITGDNARAVASESKWGLSNVLQSTFPGGLAPVAQ